VEFAAAAGFPMSSKLYWLQLGARLAAMLHLALQLLLLVLLIFLAWMCLLLDIELLLVRTFNQFERRKRSCLQLILNFAS